MTVRLIVVELAEDTTATHCGGCSDVVTDYDDGEPFCRYGYLDTEENDDGDYVPLRSPKCVEAEARAARMVEISPLQARAIVERDFPGITWAEVKALRGEGVAILEEHAKKGGGDGG